MDFEYFDIHSHLHFKDFDADREEVIAEMKKNKIGTISVGVDFETSKGEVELAERHENVFACIGIHPEDLPVDTLYDISYSVNKLEGLVNNPKVVAIGECGLDYFFTQPPTKGRPLQSAEEIKKIQKELFEAQINLAVRVNKPLMIHVRPTDKINYDAYKDTLDILESYSKKIGDELRGNAHFFVGNVEILKRFLNIGFSVSFAGVITFAREYDEVIKFAPLERIMSETDSPFVAPVPYRGKRNSPLYISHIVQKIAEIRDEPLDLVKKSLVENAIKFFRLL